MTRRLVATLTVALAAASLYVDPWLPLPVLIGLAVAWDHLPNGES